MTITSLVISKPGRYRDSLEVLLSAIPDIKRADSVDTLEEAEKILSDRPFYDLIILDAVQEDQDLDSALSSIKKLTSSSKLLVMADVMVWQKLRISSEADYVSLKGFTIRHLRQAIHSLFGKNGHMNMLDAFIEKPDVLNVKSNLQ